MKTSPSRASLTGLGVLVAALWCGPVAARPWNTNTLAFVYPPAVGEYTGFIRQTNDAGVPERVGHFDLRVAENGRFRGNLSLGRSTYLLSYPLESPLYEDNILHGWDAGFLLASGSIWDGDFRWRGRADLRFDLGSEIIRVGGTVSDERYHFSDPVPATWVAPVEGRQAGRFNKANRAPQAGTWTLVFPGGESEREPRGAGFATVTVDPYGRVAVAAFLADGTRFTQRTVLGQDARWTLFGRLYDALGSVSGWMDLAPGTGVAPGGTALWLKPAGGIPPYAGGFANNLEVEGSRYFAATSIGTVLGSTNGIVVLSGAGLSTPQINTFVVTPKGKIISSNPTGFGLKLVGKTGVFQGWVKTASGGKVPFKGALLPSRNCGYGFFLNGSQPSGLVYLGPTS